MRTNYATKNSRRADSVRKQIIAGAVVITSIMIICLSISMTAKSMAGDNGYNEKYYDVIEAEYMQEMRAVLQEHQLYTSGITMTKVTDEEGNREYRVLIHDARIDQMDAEDISVIEGRLAEISFTEEGIVFHHELAGNV